MAQSMTGYGEGNAENERYEARVTLRSVNHRFLDLSLRVPEEHRALESVLVQQLRAGLDRGRVELRLSLKGRLRREVDIEIDEAVAERYIATASRLAKHSGADSGLQSGDLLRLPGVVSVEAAEQDFSDSDRELVGRAAAEAIDALKAARGKEGAQLTTVLSRSVGELNGVVGQLAELADTVRDELLGRLRARLADLVGGSAIDEDRLAQEAALLADRADIREEIDRLELHVENFRALLEAEGAIGKRLDFLAQEILRELNTIGSKSRASRATELVLDGKVLCEQLREQVQNVE